MQVFGCAKYRQSAQHHEPCMSNLPTGTVTFLFTDIEGGTTHSALCAITYAILSW